MSVDDNAKQWDFPVRKAAGALGGFAQDVMLTDVTQPYGAPSGKTP